MTFDSHIPIWLAAILLVPLTVTFLWLDWRRLSRFRMLRLIAVCLMMTMLAGMLLRPRYTKKQTGSILLLTSYYDQQKADSLLKADSDLIVIRTADADPYENATTLPSFYDLIDMQNNIRFVLGQGLPSDVLDMMDFKTYKFFPGTNQKGITKLNVPDLITANTRNSVTGTFWNAGGRKWIYLNSPGKTEDSVIIEGSGSKSFILSFSSIQSGDLLYSISVKDSVRQLSHESFPIHVTDPEALSILVILGYPTFETQYLKNFLTSKGSKLVIRSQLSRSNARFEYANHAPIQFNNLTKKVLDDFDILMIDQESMKTLSAQEKTMMEQSIRGGLGLLTLQNSLIKRSAKTDRLYPFQTTSINSDTTVIVSGTRAITLPALPLRVINVPPLQPVLTNKSGILSGYTFMGKGKIGFQYVQETYQTMLSGDSLTYSSLWSPLLDNIGRTHDIQSTVRIVNEFPLRMDEPFLVEVISSAESPVLFADSVRVPLQEDVLVDGIWRATLWGGTPGWHRLQIDETALTYFISANDEWRTLSLQQQLEKNGEPGMNKKTTAFQTAEQRPVRPVYLFLFFVIAAGFLWLAPKL